MTVRPHSRVLPSSAAYAVAIVKRNGVEVEWWLAMYEIRKSSTSKPSTRSAKARPAPPIDGERGHTPAVGGRSTPGYHTGSYEGCGERHRDIGISENAIKRRLRDHLYRRTCPPAGPGTPHRA